jgi:hypothetical protein
MNYSYKKIENSGVMGNMRTHSKRRFISSLRTINWANKHLKVVLRVNYGKGFINEGVYEKDKDLWLAFEAFTEKK